MGQCCKAADQLWRTDGGGGVTLLVLKLLLVPAFLAVISFAGRRWGPGVAGWLGGFPSLTGPVLLFLAIERGPEFTSQAAVLSLSAVFSAVAFGIAYAWACRRLPWVGALACAYAAWFASVNLLVRLPLSLPWLSVFALAMLIVAPRAFPRAQGTWGTHALPAQELLLRMAAGAAMVLAVTGMAEALGPAWTGMFAAFPVMSTVLAVFSHRANGPGFVVAMLRAMVAGFYAYMTYCLCVAALLEHWGIAITYTVAVIATVTVQGGARAIIVRMNRSGVRVKS
jgi:uncharacterized membrane protein (GlpM family)